MYSIPLIYPYCLLYPKNADTATYNDLFYHTFAVCKTTSVQKYYKSFVNLLFSTGYAVFKERDKTFIVTQHHNTTSFTYSVLSQMKTKPHYTNYSNNLI